MTEPSVITYTNPNTGLATSVNIPSQIVEMLTWLAANAKLPDGTARYKQEADVIYQDAITKLVPDWAQAYLEGNIATLQRQMDETRRSVAGSLQAGISALLSQ